MRALPALLVVVALAAGLGSPPDARALSVAPGSETLFTQIEASEAVVLARFRAASAGELQFVAEEVLLGGAGESVSVALAEGEAFPGLDPDSRYLLMLASEGGGRFRLVMEGLSILQISEPELPEVLEAARAWVRDRDDPAASRRTLVRFATSRSMFLQRSALMALTYVRPMDRDSLQSLVDQLAAGRVVDPQARERIVRFAGVMGAMEHRDFLAARVRDASETPDLREAALFALDAMDPEMVRVLAPEIERSGTPGLRSLMRSLERTPPPPARPSPLPARPER